MTKTPAAEALDAYKSHTWYSHCDYAGLSAQDIIEQSDEENKVNHDKTIREALAIYDKIQRGEWKALAREPSKEMLAPIYGDADCFWECEGHVLQAAKDEWSEGWDAAPAHPEQTVEGESK